jgi:hypothetical protein
MKGPIAIDILAKKAVLETYFEQSHLGTIVFGGAATYSYSSLHDILQDRMLKEVQKIEEEKR